MKKRCIRTIALLLIFVFAFSGCSLLDFFSAEDLLNAPKLTGENSALQHTFEKTVGKDVSLHTPIAGDYRASYIFFDSNGDNVDEAIVFYSSKTNSSVVRMHLLSKHNNEWFSVADIIGSGTGVYKVDFINIDNEPDLEIAVSWTADDSQKEKKLSLYKITGISSENDNSIYSVATIQIADYVYFDIDSDGISELLYFYYNLDEMRNGFNTRLLDFDAEQKTLLPISDISLNSQITGVSQIYINKHQSNYSVLIDCVLNDGLYYTEIVYFDSALKALSRPESEGAYVADKSLRMARRLCEDYDGDGSIDIPCELEHDESYSTGMSDISQGQIDFFEWFTFYPDEIKIIGKFYENSADGYRMKIDKLYEHYYFVYDYENSLTQVRLKGSDESIVFTVECKKDLSPGFIDDNNDLSFDISITSKGESMNITPSFVEDLITY